MIINMIDGSGMTWEKMNHFKKQKSKMKLKNDWKTMI